MFIDTSPPDNRSEISLPSSASSSSRSAFPPPSPAKHRRSPSQFSSWPTRTKAKVSDPTANSNNDDDQHQGVDPRALVGTTIVRVKRSAQHPATTLTTSDGRAFQLRVDGYSPAYARMPRTLETNAPALFPGPGGGERAVHLTVTDARRVRMKDTAVARDESGKDSRWTVVHAAIALKFEEEDGWHAVWASVEEVAEGGACVYRTYDDVYLDEVTKKKGKGKGTWKGKGTRGWGGT